MNSHATELRYEPVPQKSVSINVIIEREQLQIWKITVNNMNFYVVKDIDADLVTELETGESNPDVGVFQTLNEALSVWKGLVIDRIKEIHF